MRRAMILAFSGVVTWIGPAAAAQGVLYAFDGSTPGDFMGGAVAAAGDVDGDGFDDVIAGLPGVGAGSARVLSGGDGSVLHTFHGGAAGDRFGEAVSGAGDVNKDGVGDVIVGALYSSINGLHSGSAHVYSGSDGSVLLVFVGDAESDRLGKSVSGAGDVNGDGWADVAVGVPGDDHQGPGKGSVRVYSGKDGALLQHLFDGGSGDFDLGESVAAAGNVNNDGFEDLIVGDTGQSTNGPNSGGARVYSGQDGQVLHAFHGDATSDRFGYSVSGAGDVNADGHDDVIVGAIQTTWGLTAKPGYARVFSGKDGSVMHTLTGDAPGDILGHSVGGAGDVNQDGLDDLLVGVPGDAGNGAWSGSARVYSGSDGALLHLVRGDSSSDSLGWSVSGNVNADGFDDFIAGAPYMPGGLYTGGVRIYSGTCGAITSYGTGCPGSGGFTPSLLATGCPTPGGTVTLEVSGGLGGASAFLFLGTQPGALPMGGTYTMNVLPPIGPFGPTPLSGAGSGTGSFALPAKLAIDAPLVTVTVQAFVQDAGGALGFSNTNGLQLMIQ